MLASPHQLSLPALSLLEQVRAAPSEEEAEGLLARAGLSESAWVRERRMLDLIGDVSGGTPEEVVAAACGALTRLARRTKRPLLGSSLLTYAFAMESGVWRKWRVELADHPRWYMLRAGIQKGVGSVPTLASELAEPPEREVAWGLLGGLSPPVRAVGALMLVTAARYTTVVAIRGGDLRPLPDGGAILSLRKDKRHPLGTRALRLVTPAAMEFVRPALPLGWDDVTGVPRDWGQRPRLFPTLSLTQAPRELPQGLTPRLTRRSGGQVLEDLGVKEATAARYLRHSVKVHRARYGGRPSAGERRCALLLSPSR